MRKKILINYITILVITSILTGYMAYYTIKTNYLDAKEEKYISNLRLIENAISENKDEELRLNFFRLAQDYSDLIDARVTFIDKNGYPLADSLNNSIIFESQTPSLGFIRALKGESTLYSEFSREMGKEYYYYGSLINLSGNDDMVLRIGDSVDRTDALIDNFLLYLMVSIFASLIIAAIISFMTVENLVKPLRELTETSKHVAAGDFSHKLEIHSDDEIGELTENFNTMTEELKSYIDSIKEVERMRKDFVANVSHELRTPLTSILGFVETLRDTDLDEQNKRKSLDIIEAESIRLKEMINKLLVLSKIESIGEQKTMSLFDLHKLIGEVLNMLRPLADKKNISTTLDFAENPLVLRGDESILRIVLINIIENCIKYNKPGGNIHIRSEECRDCISIVIQDTGIGIPRDHLGKIFERFYRIDSSRNMTNGSGLGLAIAQDIIEGLGGRIEVQSSLGEGTKFTVVLPQAV
jgi:two-component system phosphate regulon sensor histidine kinase PhoR